MDKRTRIDQAIKRFYGQRAVSTSLIEAILYSVKAGGKRIRPLILLELLEGFGLELEDSHFDVAASVELIHTGSLIHDDLPAMDNDDYRRGQLTNHKQFGQATAILAGDSLFLDPFALLAGANLSAQIKLELIRELSDAAGTYGMVGGQLLDMEAEDKQLTLAELQVLHANKTGKLLTFPFVAAGLIAKLSAKNIADLRRAGEMVGLAFQVRDDILDETAKFEEIGKTPQKDTKSAKSTYPSLLGLEKSYEILNQKLDQALTLFQNLQQDQNFKVDKITDMIEGLRLYA